MVDTTNITSRIVEKMEETETETQNEHSSSDHTHQASNRIMIHEKLKYLKVYEKMKELIDSEILLESVEILGKREVYEAANIKEDDNDLDDDKELELEKKIHLREKRDQLHKTLIKHKSLHTALQESHFETQIQNAVYNSLANDSTIPTEVRNMMEHYHSNLTVCSKLADLFSITEAHEKKLQGLRQRYRILLQSIETKWNQLSGLKPTVKQKTEEIEKLYKNVEKREERLHLLVSLLQNIISSSGEPWGSNERIVEIMLLCDKVESFLGGFGDILHDLRGLQSAREQEQNQVNTQKGPMDKFVSSTPG
ncbi:hypothetical protein Anas_13174 [Armadillidium nasatum]|uniref:Centromere protein H C-terminal domain-containing protein n=1 Tax=Armadillidium nasatum TaxID=96803 RepID=A0A5N5TBI9_9CRUS|nr:hypothetical protein Anas_13174 [Armadillidium nasatum]